MRMLGHKASLSMFRWDLVYLGAQLEADGRPEVAALLGPVQALLAELKVERDALEEAEDALLVATAVRNRRDRARDVVLLEAGGVARASNKEVYDRLFPQRSPSRTARLPLQEESAEVQRILGELGKLAADDPIRAAYEAELEAAESALAAAGSDAGEAATALALQRSELDRFKLKADQTRLSTFGKLAAFLKDKAEADTFFRAMSTSPEPEPTEPEPAAPPPA